MRYIDVLKLRDNTIRDFFVRELPVSDDEKTHYMQLFEKAVEQANNDVTTQIRVLFGEEAERVLGRKKETESANL